MTLSIHSNLLVLFLFYVFPNHGVRFTITWCTWELSLGILKREVSIYFCFGQLYGQGITIITIEYKMVILCDDSFRNVGSEYWYLLSVYHHNTSDTPHTAHITITTMRIVGGPPTGWTGPTSSYASGLPRNIAGLGILQPSMCVEATAMHLHTVCVSTGIVCQTWTQHDLLIRYVNNVQIHSWCVDLKHLIHGLVLVVSDNACSYFTVSRDACFRNQPQSSDSPRCVQMISKK